ncbi:MAG: hypothetical protein QOH21_2944 [Acidobacteriota bacterium]|jgi:hypothetical protein|nr:hypothetical protein [Acidobacteriota bacterium]
MQPRDDEQTHAYQTPVAIPLLSIDAESWLHFRPGVEPRSGEVVFGNVRGSAAVGTVHEEHDGTLVFRDGASGEKIAIKKPGDLRTFGVVVRVTRDFA